MIETIIIPVIIRGINFKLSQIMKAQPDLTQVEKDKLVIDPDFDFREFAQRPFEDITPNELAMFKWSGVYHLLQPCFLMIRCGAACPADAMLVTEPADS